MDKNMKDEIYCRFKSGETIQEIADSIGLPWGKTYSAIGGRFPMKIDLSDDDRIRIKEMYLNGLTVKRISEIYVVNQSFISKVLKDQNVELTYKNQRKHKFNEEYFDNIDTPNKAYILGFLYADGYNCLSRNTVRLTLSECDKEILERIKNEIGINFTIKIIDSSHRIYGNNYISKNSCYLEFSSKHTSSVLDELGVHQNKSLILQYPTWLNDDLHRHFIRGYYDGDGSIYRNNKSKSTLTITSTEQFCIECLKIIRNNVGIGGNIYEASNHNGITKVISIGGSVQCKNVLDWLYKDADLYLKRKYDRYLSYYYPNVA